jgi:hypothetical protein
MTIRKSKKTDSYQEKTNRKRKKTNGSLEKTNRKGKKDDKIPFKDDWINEKDVSSEGYEAFFWLKDALIARLLKYWINLLIRKYF